MEAGLGEGLEGEETDADTDECSVEGEKELVKAREGGEGDLQQRHGSVAASAAGVVVGKKRYAGVKLMRSSLKRQR